ncbi:helix-turn-helix domain-containing protein [Streptomyces sp. NPDC021224]|uniref:helix-turn-helix domain-containing protein n=1 Tax=unclassified Streptomyces TaxID=2593676 RepID=UPI0037A9A446
MAQAHETSAWRPPVAGVVEVLHARFTDHAYPMHVHDAWTLLIVDDGAVRYDLDRSEHGTPVGTVSLLPPLVPHNGSPATPHGFRKRVLYLDMTQLDERFVGPAVDTPDLADPLLRTRIGQLHQALARPGDELEAESRLALVGERLRTHLRPRLVPAGRPDTGVAHRLRDLLDAHLRDGVTLDEAARRLHAHPTHLVRAFSAAFGIAPHQYVTSRRVDLSRRMLLDGLPPAEVATAVGFYDQAHFGRHFTRVLGTAPGRYAARVRAAGGNPRRRPAAPPVRSQTMATGPSQ